MIFLTIIQGNNMDFIKKSMILVLLAIIMFSCQNKHQLNYFPMIDEVFTIDYYDNWFIVSNKESCDTFFSIMARFLIVIKDSS